MRITEVDKPKRAQESPREPRRAQESPDGLGYGAYAQKLTSPKQPKTKKAQDEPR